VNRPGLNEIVRRKKADLDKLKRDRPLEKVEKEAKRASAPRDFKKALQGGGVSLIAELKKASPSAGLLRPDYAVPRGAREYARAGAAALSVLTEENYFFGRLEDIAEAKEAVPLPVLRKDFVFDDYQIHESRAAGADAVLLIVAILTDEELKSLLALARSLRMAALVEVHAKDELDRAAAAGADIIGVNSRNLKDLSMNRTAFEELLPAVPRTAVRVAESGIKTSEDVAALKRLGCDAMLVGESLLRQPDMGGAAARLVEAGR